MQKEIFLWNREKKIYYRKKPTINNYASKTKIIDPDDRKESPVINFKWLYDQEKIDITETNNNNQKQLSSYEFSLVENGFETDPFDPSTDKIVPGEKIYYRELAIKSISFTKLPRESVVKDRPDYQSTEDIKIDYKKEETTA